MRAINVGDRKQPASKSQLVRHIGWRFQSHPRCSHFLLLELFTLGEHETMFEYNTTPIDDLGFQTILSPLLAVPIAATTISPRTTQIIPPTTLTKTIIPNPPTVS